MAGRNDSILLTLALSIWICSLAQATISTASTTLSTILPIATDGLDCSQNVNGANISACYFTLTSIPECARGCLVNVTLMTPCESTDIKCLCAHSSSIQEGAVPCLKDVCQVPDTQTTINHYYRLCKSAGFPLSEDNSIPTSALPGSTTKTTGDMAARATTSTVSSALPRNGQDPLSLSTTAKVGLAVGAAVGGVAMIIVLSVCLSRRRNKRRRKSDRRILDTRSKIPSGPERKRCRRSEKSQIYPHQKGPVELPSESPPWDQALGHYPEAGIVPRDPHDKDNWF